VPDEDAIVASEADCVVYAPRPAELDEVCALLRSGVNVVCTPFLFHRSPRAEADARRIEAACQEGGRSVHGTGIPPASSALVLPLALSGMSRTIDHVRIELSLAPESRDVRTGRLEAGAVSRQRCRWLGLRGGTRRIEIETRWSLGGFYPEPWDREARPDGERRHRDAGGRLDARALRGGRRTADHRGGLAPPEAGEARRRADVPRLHLKP
jgi:hypothetical protein